MQIVTESITIETLRAMAAGFFGNVVKAVVDVERKVIAVDAEMHADLESFLLQDGSSQRHLWGINLYLDETREPFVEFDSMINVRPSQDNRGRSVESKELRDQILEIVKERITR